MRDPLAPIGVFDSGLGGLSVLRELVRVMPEEDFLYFGDSANAPYGPRTTAEVRRLTCDAAALLLGETDGAEGACKALVVACNTATAAAIELLRASWPETPIIGIEPALKPAAGDGGPVLVLATETTLREQKFRRLLDRCRRNCEIRTLAAPGLVEFVERGELTGRAVDDYLAGLLAPYADVRFASIVLGCTHFPFVREAIRGAFPYPVRIYDGAEGTAMETRRRLTAAGLRADRRGLGCVRLCNSSGEMTDLMRRIFCQDCEKDA